MRMEDFAFNQKERYVCNWIRNQESFYGQELEMRDASNRDGRQFLIRLKERGFIRQQGNYFYYVKDSETPSTDELLARAKKLHAEIRSGGKNLNPFIDIRTPRKHVHLSIVPQSVIYAWRDGEDVYFFVVAVRCSACEKVVEGFGFLLFNYKEKGETFYAFCADCAVTVEPPPLMAEQAMWTVIIAPASQLPVGHYVVNPDRPPLHYSEISRFRSADMEEIIDKTQYSNDPDFTVQDDAAPVLIGDQKYCALAEMDEETNLNAAIAEEKGKMLPIEKTFELLDELAGKKPALPGEKKKEIGDDHEPD
jgi:hypothetical protein